MAKKRARMGNSKKKATNSKKGSSPKKRATPTKIVFDEWDYYVEVRDGATVFVSFDDQVTRDEPPAGLELCARVLIPIRKPNKAGGPVSPESEQLWAMEDELCLKLQNHKVRCRLVGRLTHSGLRELVFQLHDWDSFRPPVGLWMMEHEEYEIDVSEHEGWDFFDECVRPSDESRLFIADRQVLESLVESGSNPKKKHSLEYAFQGDAKGLRRVANLLAKRGYKPVGELDYESGVIELSKRMPLDLRAVTEESLHSFRTAEKTGVEFLGWGAAVVE